MNAFDAPEETSGRNEKMTRLLHKRGNLKNNDSPETSSSLRARARMRSSAIDRCVALGKDLDTVARAKTKGASANRNGNAGKILEVRSEFFGRSDFSRASDALSATRGLSEDAATLRSD